MIGSALLLKYIYNFCYIFISDIELSYKVAD